MSVFGLTRAFEPKSLAVVGAGPDRGSLGGAVFANLRSAGFPGRIDPVNPRHTEIAGQACFASIENLEAAPDLLVVATPAATLPEITRQAGAIAYDNAFYLLALVAAATLPFLWLLRAPRRWSIFCIREKRPRRPISGRSICRSRRRLPRWCYWDWG